jgi:dsDNA-specific endonuclease/ATPase MutS2
MAKFKVGDRVRNISNGAHGIILEVVTYAAMGNKLRVRLHSGHEDLLAIECRQKIR